MDGCFDGVGGLWKCGCMGILWEDDVCVVRVRFLFWRVLYVVLW